MDLRAILSSLPIAKSGEAGKISLMKGQVFLGRVLKLFPNSHALVQLGGLQVHAKLEAQLEAGKSYWLQVANSSGTPELKVLDEKETGNAGKGMIEALFQRIGLSPTRTREAVIRTFLNDNIPFSKEMITRGGEWLKNVENPTDGLDVLKDMAKRQLPFSQNVFQSLLIGKKDEPIHEQLAQLSAVLEKANEDKEPIKQLRQLLPELSVKASDSGSAFKQSLERVFSLFGLSYEHDLVQLDQQPGTFNRNQLKPILQQIIQGKSPPELKQQARQLLAQLNQDKPVTTLELQKTIQPEIEQVIERWAAQPKQTHFAADKEELTNTLKPLLMQVAEHTESANVKQQAQQLIHHLTAQQLNGAGPFQTMIQFPLNTGTYQSNALLKWEGKKTKSGVFDPDFCRILFYLDLEHLRETTVDVNVQKRVVTIRIYNDTHQLNELIERFEPLLKKNLESAGYQLSSLKQSKGQPRKSGDQSSPIHLDGVDFRI